MKGCDGTHAAFGESEEEVTTGSHSQDRLLLISKNGIFPKEVCLQEGQISFSFASFSLSDRVWKNVREIESHSANLEILRESEEDEERK